MEIDARGWMVGLDVKQLIFMIFISWSRFYWRSELSLKDEGKPRKTILILCRKAMFQATRVVKKFFFVARRSNQ